MNLFLSDTVSWIIIWFPAKVWRPKTSKNISQKYMPVIGAKCCLLSAI